MFYLCAGPEADDREVRPLISELDNPEFTLVVCVPSPPNDVVSVGEECTQRWLDIAVPQNLAPESSPNCTNRNLAHHCDPRQVQPHKEIRLVGEQIANGAVLPFRHPSRLRAECSDIGPELLTRCPVRPVVKRIDLDMFEAEKRRNPGGQSRLSGA